MKNAIFVSILFFANTLQAFEFKEFDIYQETVPYEKVAHKIENYLQKDEQIDDYYELNEKIFYLYEGMEYNLMSLPEYAIVFGDKMKKKLIKIPPTSLQGLRVAIDPGHFGGPLAKAEDRYIEVQNGDTTISFDEGTLTLFTAKWLKKMLEDEGAIVMLTRDELGKGVYEESFAKWEKKQRDLDHLSSTDRFRKHYNVLDLRKRAHKINSFHPDLTIIIHYNVKDNSRNPETNELIPTLENYSMAFVGGSFLKEELMQKESRVEFIRFLVTDDIEDSIRLSRCALNELEKILKVPLRPMDAKEKYIKDACIPVERGIFCRNLIMTRLVRGPLVYGETLFQNNVNELDQLCQTDLEIDGIKGPKRAQDVAKGYFEGIKAYLLENNAIITKATTRTRSS